MLGVVILLLKILFTLVLLFIVKTVYYHFKAVRRVKFYINQGIPAMPGFDRFPLGNAKDI